MRLLTKLHKTIRKKRIQRSYNDGYVSIVAKEHERDEFNTIIPNRFKTEELGRYAFRLEPIHSSDKFEFGRDNVRLRYNIRIPENHFIHAGMTAQINGETFDIVKTYSDIRNSELEITLAEEGGRVDIKKQN